MASPELHTPGVSPVPGGVEQQSDGMDGARQQADTNGHIPETHQPDAEAEGGGGQQRDPKKRKKAAASTKEPKAPGETAVWPVSYTHLRAHET